MSKSERGTLLEKTSWNRTNASRTQNRSESESDSQGDARSHPDSAVYGRSAYISLSLLKSEPAGAEPRSKGGWDLLIY